MNSTDLLGYFRTQIRDEEKPYLWTDEEVLSYMDDAHRMFARRTGCIRDATSALCTLKFGVDKKFVAYDERILGIRYAELNSTGRKLNIVNLENEVEGGILPEYDYNSLIWRSRLNDPSGVVDTLVLGMDSDNIRVIPPSAEADSATLVIFREPLSTINAEGQEFEIPERHHTSLYFWMAHKAYNKQDVDTYDKTKSDDFGQKFLDYCAWVKAEDVGRREHRVRTVRYGGI